MDEEVGILATLLIPIKGDRTVKLICKTGAKWLVRICESGIEIEVYEEEFVLD